MSGPYAILEADRLLVLHQQNHLPPFFFLLLFLVFLVVGQVDLRRRHLGFKQIHVKQLQAILALTLAGFKHTKSNTRLGFSIHFCVFEMQTRMSMWMLKENKTLHSGTEAGHKSKAPEFYWWKPLGVFSNKFLLLYYSEKKTLEMCKEQQGWWLEEWLFRKYHIPHEFEFLNPFENPVLLKNLWLQNGKNWLKGHSRQILKVILTMATFLNIYNYFIVSSEQWSESLIFMGKCFPNYLILHSLPTTYIFSSLLISPLPEDHEIKKGIRCPLAYFFTAAAFIGFICSRQNFQFGTQSFPFGTTTIWGTGKKKRRQHAVMFCETTI